MVQAIQPKNNNLVEKAKQVPIQSLLFVQPIPDGVHRLKICCPFHQEDTPSFIIYSNNTYYCFGGCGGGDSIAFYMKLHGVGFKEAVKELAR